MDRENVLVVCDDEGCARDIIGRLYEADHDAIGPVGTAGLALALAAQAAPTMALIARRPTGRRTAEQLAGELLETWGVRSLILPEAGSEAAEPQGDGGAAELESREAALAARLSVVAGLAQDDDIPEQSAARRELAAV